MRSSRIFSGDFHTPNQKTRILPLFLRFLLAFPVFLGYSPCRPSISRKIEGSRTLGACFDRIGACPDCLGVESKIRRRSEEHTSELQSRLHLVCRLLLEKKITRIHSLIR